MYLWDSDTLRAYGDGHLALFERLQQVRRSEVALPSVILGEVLRGRIDYALKADTVDRLVLAHRLLLQTWDMLNTFQIVAFDEASGQEFTSLTAKSRRHKRRADVLIASVARAGGHIVVTRNLRDFEDLLPAGQFTNWLV